MLNNGLLMSYNFPYEDEKNNQIVWQGYKNISFILKDNDYEYIYNECLKYKAFNFILIDGGVIQMMYKFEGRVFVEHRLSYLPSPNNERYDDLDDFEGKYYTGLNLFTEINNKNAVVFPIRFDYSSDVKKYINNDHSYSHLSLGNYKNCRIPVNNFLEPLKFIEFILRNFYFTKFKKIEKNFLKIDKISLNNNILSESEKKVIHINFEN